MMAAFDPREVCWRRDWWRRWTLGRALAAAVEAGPHDVDPSLPGLD